MIPKLVVGGESAGALPAEYDDAPTGKLVVMPSELTEAEEDDSTSLSVESRIRKALAVLEDEPPLVPTLPADPILPKSARALLMELLPTMPAELRPAAQARADGVPVEPRGPQGTVKIVWRAEGPPIIVPALEVPPPEPAPPQLATVLSRPRRGWPRVFVLTLLAALLAVGFVKRTAVAELVLKTTAAIGW